MDAAKTISKLGHVYFKDEVPFPSTIHSSGSTIWTRLSFGPPGVRWLFGPTWNKRRKESHMTDTAEPETTIETEDGIVTRRVTRDGAIEYTLNETELHHRLDGPAITYVNGWAEWRQHGALHREDDLPARTLPEGDEEWWIRGQRHRPDGPAHRAFTEDGVLVLERWFVNGKQHREDGPANIYYDMDKREWEYDYWLDGEQVDPKDLPVPPQGEWGLHPAVS